MRIKLTIEYDGTNYSGWQIQPNGITVEETIETALKTITGEDITITGSGRTDAGVHAEGQVAHFDYSGAIPPEKFSYALNTVLPEDVKILKSEKAKDGFDARKSAKQKTYEYSFYVSDVVKPLKERYSVNLRQLPDIKKMQSVAKLLEGKHNFKAFSSSGGGAKTFEREIYSLTVKNKGKDIIVSVTGNGFLYNMVRIIAGTLIAVGYKKTTEEDVIKALETGKRTLLGKTLPAKGLKLKSVKYR